jgi:hypothetical protein
MTKPTSSAGHAPAGDKAEVQLTFNTDFPHGPVAGGSYGSVSR